MLQKHDLLEFVMEASDERLVTRIIGENESEKERFYKIVMLPEVCVNIFVNKNTRNGVIQR